MKKKITKADVEVSATDKLSQLKQYGDKNGCDAVLLLDGTIKKYMGERWNIVAIYKVNIRKVYKF